MGVKLKNVGKTGWRGWDTDGRELHAAPGSVVEMSEERARKLLGDFRSFEIVEIPVLPEPEPKPQVEPLAEQPFPIRPRRGRRG